ncbi:MAG TPA: hydantoinase/oxoprolinase family protein [Xanthobacteraceae bacterium]|nr:hydantoinase/oxoprolinase family protein [Xanthobacteraceae bacterium]
MASEGRERRFKVGIDVGGTFTDFYVREAAREPVIHKVLSTSADPSIGVLAGLRELAGALDEPLALADFLGDVEVIVHGTTVTTNATLTRRGAKTGLITTAGVRDALEMRRGIREERYNNRYTNVAPVVPRYLRIGVAERLDRRGRTVTPLALDDVRRAIDLFKAEEVKAVAICFMNAFTNPAHEAEAAALVRQEMPDAFLTTSTELLPAIRFYDRVSTTALNAYVGPILDHYLAQLQRRLTDAGFAGALLVMQSNGGVMTPDVARKSPALTLLSGPAGGPIAGLAAARPHGMESCIVIDMGGTSFEAALVEKTPVVIKDGEIDRLRCALPMLGIHTIGAGGGSIGWIDQGGLLRMGPHSAGAKPGPACYCLGGEEPTTSDANLVLGYLSADFFSGGRIKLDAKAARDAIAAKIAAPLGMTVEAAAAGMYRVACTNMAQGVRAVTIERGSDPREFPLVVAGGAGPLHSCVICNDLDIALQIVPRESSVLCASGMLMGDLRHDFVRTFVDRFPDLRWPKLNALTAEMIAGGDRILDTENIGPERRQHAVTLDCRYLKQYHEVSFPVPLAAIENHDAPAILRAFHDEHNRLFGYSLEQEGTPVEMVNVRVQSIGMTDKSEALGEPFGGADAAAARKGERSAYVFERQAFETIPVFDGHRLHHGNRIAGPALVEMVTTTAFVSASYDAVTDRFGSLLMYRKGREDLVKTCLAETAT